MRQEFLHYSLQALPPPPPLFFPISVHLFSPPFSHPLCRSLFLLPRFHTAAAVFHVHSPYTFCFSVHLATCQKPIEWSLELSPPCTQACWWCLLIYFRYTSLQTDYQVGRPRAGPIGQKLLNIPRKGRVHSGGYSVRTDTLHFWLSKKAWDHGAGCRERVILCNK